MSPALQERDTKPAGKERNIHHIKGNAVNLKDCHPPKHAQDSNAQLPRNVGRSTHNLRHSTQYLRHSTQYVRRSTQYVRRSTQYVRHTHTHTHTQRTGEAQSFTSNKTLKSFHFHGTLNVLNPASRSTLASNVPRPCTAQAQRKPIALCAKVNAQGTAHAATLTS